MITPSSRLLWLATLVSGAAALVSALAPEWAAAAAAALGITTLAALADAWAAASALDRIRISAAAGPVRLWKDREGEIPLSIERPEQDRRPIAAALFLALPADVATPEETLAVTIPGAAARSRLAWPVVPRRRGRFAVNLAALQAGSVLGLWNVRRRFPLDCSLQVYPNLLKDRKTMAGIFLNRGTAGIHKRRQVGRGREFDRLRDYLPGDSLGTIHWKTTAKRGRPVTKEYRIERTQEVYAVIDASRLSARVIDSPGAEAPAENLLEHFLRAALILGMVAQRQGDLFGLAVFADQVRVFLRAAGGAAHFNACREAIYRTEPALVSPDYRELFTFLRLRLRRRALLMILTDLNDPLLAEEFTRNLPVLSRRHLVFTAMVEPAGAVPVFTGPPVQTPAEIADRLAGHLQWRDLRRLERSLRRRGTGFGLLPRDHMSLELVSRYSDIKQRQLL